MGSFMDMPRYLQMAICIAFVVATLPYLAFFVFSLKNIVMLNADKARKFEINCFFKIGEKIKATSDINKAIEFISGNQKEKEKMSALFDLAAFWALIAHFAITFFATNEMSETGIQLINSLLSDRNNGVFVGIQIVQFIMLFSVYCYMLALKKMNELQFNHEVYLLGNLETQLLSPDDARAIKGNKITGEYVERVMNAGRKLTRKETDMLLDFIDEEEEMARSCISSKILYGE